MRCLVVAWLLFFLFGCATAPVNVEIAKTPTYDEKSASQLEKSLGEAGYYYMLLNFKFVDDQQAINRLSRLGARLARYTERPNIKYGYFIIDSKYRNGFSIPDGYIFISNSLIETLKEDGLIAAVLAHEIAHITHRHMLEAYQRAKNYKPWKAILGQEVFNLVSKMGYNRAYELQADQTSLVYLYRAGFDPALAVELLQRYKSIEKEDEEEYKKTTAAGKKKNLERPLDHPYTENRIVSALNYLPLLPEKESVQYKSEDFNF